MKNTLSSPLGRRRSFCRSLNAAHFHFTRRRRRRQGRLKFEVWAACEEAGRGWKRRLASALTTAFRLCHGSVFFCLFLATLAAEVRVQLSDTIVDTRYQTFSMKVADTICHVC